MKPNAINQTFLCKASMKLEGALPAPVECDGWRQGLSDTPEVRLGRLGESRATQRHSPPEGRGVDRRRAEYPATQGVDLRA